MLGSIFTFFSNLFLGSWLGRIKLDIRPNARAGAKYHGFYAASETKDHHESNNFFLMSCDLNNGSRKPFVISNYNAFVRTNKDSEWLELAKHESPMQHLYPLKTLHLSLDLSNFKQNPIFIEFLMKTNSIAAESYTNVIFFMELPLDKLRLNNLYGDQMIECKLRLLERRGKWVENTFPLKRIFYKKDAGGTSFGCYDDAYKESIPSSGVLIKE